MDYRHTEDFARRMERAELRAQSLRSEAFADAGRAAVRALRGLARLVQERLARRNAVTLPEA